MWEGMGWVRSEGVCVEGWRETHFHRPDNNDLDSPEAQGAVRTLFRLLRRNRVGRRQGAK